MKSNKTRYAILGTLSMWPMTGYDIRKVLANGAGMFWSESYGQLYPELRKMAGLGLIRMSEELKKGKPRRVVYTLTSKGRDELREWLMKSATPAPVRDEVLLKLFFGSQVEAEVSLDRIRKFRQYHLECLQKCDRVEKTLDAAGKTPDTIFWVITLKYGQHVSRSLIDWCDETLKMLSARKLQRQLE